MRPAGLRLSTITRSWYRIDQQAPVRWSWAAFAEPRSRFDSAAGRQRVRYAGDESRVAMRERFDQDHRVLRSEHLGLHLIELTGALRVIDLRRDRVLDALGLDDQVSTGRAPGVWAACQWLTDLVHEWFGERCHGLVYRSRTTPERSANLAFFAHAPLQAHDLGVLAEQGELLVRSVTEDGFTIQGWR